MSIRALGVCALLLFAAPAEAGNPFDIHGLIVGNEGARYVKGVPTLDLQQQNGAIELRSLGFYDHRPVFAIAFYNAGPEPVNIGLEDIHATSNGDPLTVFPVAELERQAKHKAWWAEFGLALLGGVSAGLSASSRDTYQSTISGPYGSYTVSSSFPSLYGQLQADRTLANTEFGIAAIQYQLDRTIERINDHVVQRTTVDPGQSYAGLLVLDKLKRGDPPFELHLDVDWNGERYPFAYVMQKPGMSVPDRYSAMLAEHAKPRARVAAFAAPRSQDGEAASAMVAGRKMPDGAIQLPSGAVKIPAKTSSGYCLKTPRDYVATGDENYPVITGAMPRCLDDNGRVATDHKESAFRPY